MIPHGVKQVLDALHILSLEVQSMPKEYGVEFGNPSRYPYLSVCTISTHDMPSLRGWWEEDSERARRYYRNVLGRTDDFPEAITPEVCNEVLRQNLLANSMLCIFSLQDWLSIDAQTRVTAPADERINVPSNPNQRWVYRMPFTIEQLWEMSDLTSKIRLLLKQTHRSNPS
jgi:4-alpha-glucanotransferase